MKFIVFFDDKCPLCRRTVNFLYRHDRHRRLQFASLEGKTAGTYLAKKSRALNTVIFFEHPNQYFIRGRAVFRILGRLGGFWILTWWMQYLPGIDRAYQWIAHHRRRGGGLPSLKVSLLP